VLQTCIKSWYATVGNGPNADCKAASHQCICSAEFVCELYIYIVDAVQGGESEAEEEGEKVASPAKQKASKSRATGATFKAEERDSMAAPNDVAKRHGANRVRQQDRFTIHVY